MDSEMSTLQTNHTLDLVPKPSQANIVGCRWSYRYKFYRHGRLDHYKGSLVAQGLSHKPGLEFDDTFSPVFNPLPFALSSTFLSPER